MLSVISKGRSRNARFGRGDQAMDNQPALHEPAAATVQASVAALRGTRQVEADALEQWHVAAEF